MLRLAALALGLLVQPAWADELVVKPVPKTPEIVVLRIPTDAPKVGDRMLCEVGRWKVVKQFEYGDNAFQIDPADLSQGDQRTFHVTDQTTKSDLGVDDPYFVWPSPRLK